eukprot:11973.XXX_435855_436046_1 [CDS] Oithona nana genome sequencing.
MFRTFLELKRAHWGVLPQKNIIWLRASNLKSFSSKYPLPGEKVHSANFFSAHSSKVILNHSSL